MKTASNKIGIFAGIICMVLGLAGVARAETFPRAAMLDGFSAGQWGSGIYALRASADRSPISATFFMTNLQTNERSSVVGDCVVDTTTWDQSGSCVKEVDTLALTSGPYLIIARVSYADEVTVVSNALSVDFPVVQQVDVSIPRVNPVPARPRPEPVIAKSLFGQLLDKIRYQNNTPKEQTDLAQPIVKEIRDIWIDLKGGERSAIDASRRLGTLQAELWEEIDITSPTVRAKTKYQSAQDYGAMIDASAMRIADLSITTEPTSIIVSATTTNARGEQLIVQERRRIIKETLHFSGKTLPNMYATVYVYGETPTICVAKASAEGNWSCEVIDQLASGNYTAYVAVMEYTGKVIVKSQRFGFVKAGSVITIEQIAPTGEEIESATTTAQKQNARQIIILLAITIVGVGILVAIFFAIRAAIQRNNLV